MKKMTGKSSLKRGDVFWVDFNPTIGTEVKKTRPAIIVSNDCLNKYLPRLIVVPVTSNVEKIFDFDVQVLIRKREGKAMLDQLRSIDKRRIGKKICSLTDSEMKEIDRAMKITFSLS